MSNAEFFIKQIYLNLKKRQEKYDMRVKKAKHK